MTVSYLAANALICLICYVLGILTVFVVFRPRLDFVPGERVVCVKSDHSAGIERGMLGKIDTDAQIIDADLRYGVRWDNGEETYTLPHVIATLDERELRKFRHEVLDPINHARH